MIDLYGCGSPNVLKVLFMLGETALPYTLHQFNMARGEHFAPSLVALNPNAKLPVIVDREGPGGMPHTVFESGAILIYLAEKSGQGLPADPSDRSRAMQWLMWQMASVGPMFGQALHFRFIAPEGNDYARRRYAREVERLYDVAEARLTQVPWLAGQAFSIADMACFPWLGKYTKTLEIDMAQRPAVQAWITAIEARPGYQAVAEIGKLLYKEGLQAQKEATPRQLARFFGQEVPDGSSGGHSVSLR